MEIKRVCFGGSEASHIDVYNQICPLCDTAHEISSHDGCEDGPYNSFIRFHLVTERDVPTRWDVGTMIIYCKELEDWYPLTVEALHVFQKN